MRLGWRMAGQAGGAGAARGGIGGLWLYAVFRDHAKMVLKMVLAQDGFC